jgi:prepilin-type processing-associated H-X9-DG protein
MVQGAKGWDFPNYNQLGVGGSTDISTTPLPGTSTRFRFVKTTQVKASSETLLLAEAPRDDNAQAYHSSPNVAVLYPQRQMQFSNGVPIKPFHPGDTWNYLFCDGHVERLTPQQTVRSSYNVAVDYNSKNPNYMWTIDPDD